MKPLENNRRGRALKGMAILLGLLVAMPAAARQPKVPNPNAPTALGTVQDAESESKKHLEELQARNAQLAREEERLRQHAIDTGRKLQLREKAMTDTESHLRDLQAEENGLLKQLKERQNTLSSILAALQLMERNKPPALVVRPNDAVDAARTAMLLGSILPGLQEQADALGHDLKALVSLRKGILDQREQLARDRESLEADRLRMSELIEKKKKLQVATAREMKKERAKLTQLASQAKDLESLVRDIDDFERNKPARNQVASAVPLGPRSLTPERGLIRRLDEVKGQLRPPVIGTVVRHFREKDRMGQLSDGVTLRTRPGAQVVAPFDSTITFARPLRGYGQLLILSTDDGYHFVLAGMNKIYGIEGQKLLEGEPVGVMGASEEDVQVLDVPHGTGGSGDTMVVNSGPDLYFELRKNRKPINPLPWLATARLERTTE